MGNTADKPLPLAVSLPQAKPFSPTQPAPSNPIPVPPPKEAQTNFMLLEAIKKRDIILLKKAVERYQVKPTEIIGSSNQAKTVLHKLAEHNFSEGMALFLEEMSKHNMPLQISRTLNMKDSDGNTPMLLCCLANAVETLEVLSRCEYIDMEAQNCARKTALEIAMEMESSCVHVLTSLTAGSNPTTKATIKGSMEGSQQIRSLDEASKGFPLEKDEDVISDGNDTRTSLDCRSPMLPQGKNSNNKDLKELQENTYEKRNGKLWETFNTDNNTSYSSFVDIEFPHETYFLENEYYEGTLIKKFPKLKWTRASNFLGLFPDTLTVFDHFEPNVVSKTPLAGCEIYSALAAMAEFPQRLTKVFNTKDASKFGAYSVNFTVAGVPIEIILDDYFPSTDGSQFLYSRSISNELWFSLLEKAFAKLHGGYYALDGVGIAEALETLTGMPVAQRAMRDAEEDKLWAKLMDYDKRNYIVCAGERKLCHNGFKNRIYTVVSIIEADNYRLVKLRNHFDDYSWEGNFSHSSPLWTEQLKEQVGYCATEKTCFYMELRDFIDQFESLTVCHYHDKWVRNTVQTVCKPNHPVYFELNVEKEMEAYISVHQKDPKFVEEDPGYGISPVEIILARDLDGTGLESIAFGERDAFLGKSAVYVHESHKVKLQPGKYLIYVKIRWVDYDSHDFFLNVLSSLPAKVSTVNQPSEFNFLEKVYLNAGIASKEKFNIMNDCQFASGWSGSHLWMYACNKTNKTWHLEITFEKMINLKLGKKCRSEENVIKFTIPPNDKAVAYAKRKSSSAVSVGWTFTQKLE